jgi:hypothetical protein
VLHILTHQPFDIIDLLLAEIEDVITDGMGVARQLPYDHWISYIYSRIAPAEGVASAYASFDQPIVGTTGSVACHFCPA